MRLKKLSKILSEIDRFRDVVEEAVKEADNPSQRYNFDKDEFIEVHDTDISGTHLSGAVKRKYIDMKYEINKLINN